MLSIEWPICHDELVAYRPLIIWGKDVLIGITRSKLDFD